MIILDTNVLAELMRAAADRRVLAWVSAQAAAGLFTTALSEAEIRYGIAVLPAGRRRKALEEAVAGLFADFGDRVLAFDSAAAQAYAAIAADRRKAGRPISFADAQIAAIARALGARLATRNTPDFDGCGVQVIDPWKA